MAKSTQARPVKTPGRAVALCDDNDAEARRLAGIELRRKTVAATMIYAGTGVRAAPRVTKAAPKMTTAKRPAAKKPDDKGAVPGTPATRRPEAKTAKAPEAAQLQRPETPVAASKRKRVRTPVQLIGRLVDTIDGQLDQIDAILRDPDRGDSGPSDAERHARTVAALARVTVELRKELEAGRRRRADDNSAPGRDQSSDHDRPRDLDELRERLSRRLDERLGSGSVASVADDAAGGDRVSQ